MENNKVMTPAEWRLSKELAPIDAREKLLMEEYAQYYHSFQQPKTAKEVEDAIEREYPIDIGNSKVPVYQYNEVKELERSAMRKGYSLKGDVQTCPRCNGEGNIPNPYQTSAVNIQCPVCLGARVLYSQPLKSNSEASAINDAIYFADWLIDNDYDRDEYLEGMWECDKTNFKTTEELYWIFKGCDYSLKSDVDWDEIERGWLDEWAIPDQEPDIMHMAFDWLRSSLSKVVVGDAVEFGKWINKNEVVFNWNLKNECAYKGNVYSIEQLYQLFKQSTISSPTK